MLKRFVLSNEEKVKIRAYSDCGKSDRAITKLIGRSQKVVSTCFKMSYVYLITKRGINEPICDSKAVL